MAPAMLTVLSVICLSVYQIVNCARILAVLPVPSISHQVVYRALTMELAKRGHELTVVTTDPVKDHKLPPEKYKQIDVHDISYKMWREMFNFAELRDASDQPKDVYPMFKEALLKIFDAQLNMPEVQEIIGNKTEKFDLLLLESLIRQNFGFVWKFNAPLIGISSLTGMLNNFDAVGNPSHPLLYPDMFRQKTGKLDIWDKISTVYSDLFIRYTDYSFLDRENALARKHFGEDMPSLTELERRMDMLFLNVHPILAGIRPVVPAVVFMGGLHLKTKNKLPKDLQAFLDESPQGVVYMSLGSNVMSKSLPPETLRLMVEVFRGLPYRVLWKFEGELPDQPSNVRISKWLPQQDLLGHPNIKAFITQGGQQSMEEAIRDHVPLVGIPFIADQDLNVQNFVLLGIGVGLNIKTLNKETFEGAIMNATTDTKYKKNMKRLSELLYDQPMSGLERAVWWTEYVLRHRGAAHLRAPAAGLSLIEYFMLDLIAVVLAIVVAVTLIVAYLSIVIYKYVYNKNIKIKKQ